MAADAPELVRLRAVMLASMSGTQPEGQEWRRAAEEELRARLPVPEATMAAYVVDAPARPGVLTACAVGTVERRLAGPANPTGLAGYLFNVSTDPAYRRRGHARACVAALVAWFRTSGAGRVDLQATGAGESLYASLGFRRREEPVMRLDART